VLHSLGELAFLGTAQTQGRFHREDVYMPITPMFHVHAWGFPWAATMAGAKQVYPGRYDPAMLVKLIKTEGVTMTHGVPTILQMLLAGAASANVDLKGLKMVIGRSALPKALAKQALAAGIDIYAGYGMKRMGTNDDIAWLAMLLASPLATYISGAVIPCDGGGAVESVKAMIEAAGAAQAQAKQVNPG